MPAQHILNCSSLRFEFIRACACATILAHCAIVRSLERMTFIETIFFAGKLFHHAPAKRVSIQLISPPECIILTCLGDMK